MINKTLSERIAELNEIKKSYEFEPTNNEFFKAMKVIEELQAENQTLLAKVKELQENYDIILENHNHFLNKPIYAHCDKLEAKVKELEKVCQDSKEYNKFCSFKCLGKSKLKNIVNEKEASEVDRALEELKQIYNSLPAQYSLYGKAVQNLINALEVEKAGMNLVKDALKDGVKQMEEFNQRMDEQYPMSKPEPKIDIKEEFIDAIERGNTEIEKELKESIWKEEYVEPVSIWKDVSELPKILEGDTLDSLIRDKNGNVARTIFYNENGEIDHSPSGLEFKKEYCTITDFINSFEQMQKDIEELKRK